MIVALIAVLAVVAVGFFGFQVGDLWGDASERLVDPVTATTTADQDGSGGDGGSGGSGGSGSGGTIEVCVDGTGTTVPCPTTTTGS